MFKVLQQWQASVDKSKLKIDNMLLKLQKAAPKHCFARGHVKFKSTDPQTGVSHSTNNC